RCPAMRLLSIRSDHVRRRAAQHRRGGHRRFDSQCHVRQPVPLRYVRAHQQSDQARGVRVEGGVMMNSRVNLSRRVCLKQTATVTGGLAIAFYLPSDLAAMDPKAPAPAGEFEPNAWVRILPDGTVKLVVHKHDSGTGTHTALAACVAEELGVNPMTVQ